MRGRAAISPGNISATLRRMAPFSSGEKLSGVFSNICGPLWPRGSEQRTGWDLAGSLSAFHEATSREHAALMSPDSPAANAVIKSWLCCGSTQDCRISESPITKLPKDWNTARFNWKALTSKESGQSGFQRQRRPQQAREEVTSFHT